MSSRLHYLAAFVLMLAAAFSRLIPHPANFAPVAAIALFGGFYFDRRFALAVPLAAMLISDYFLGFYSEAVYVYAAFVMTGIIALALQKKRSVPVVASATLGSSILFFIVTNFGSWTVMPDVYARSIDGLIACYAAAIPFFRNSLAGDLVYVAVLFGSYEAVARLVVRRAVVKA